MLLGYRRASQADGSQVLDLQRDALHAAGVAPERCYEDLASGLYRYVNGHGTPKARGHTLLMGSSSRAERSAAGSPRQDQ